MKKRVAALIFISFFSVFMLCGCTKNTSGYSYELTSSDWQARLKGGAEVSLSFEGDLAQLLIKNSGKTAKIKGRYIADDSSFVIFDDEIYRNYGFEYTSNKSTLDLKYNGSSITLSKIE